MNYLREILTFAIESRPVKLRKQPPALTTMRKDRTMAKRADITPELLRQLLCYNPQTGELIWRQRARSNQSWNTKYAGMSAFKHVNSDGYLSGATMKVAMLAHRVAWMIHYGQNVIGQIDHINGVKTDNRIVNLRQVSAAENSRNCSISTRNKSGRVGVSWCSKFNKWRACLDFNRKRVHLGYFNSKECAISARNDAEIKYGFHPNHGRPRA